MSSLKGVLISMCLLSLAYAKLCHVGDDLAHLYQVVERGSYKRLYVKSTGDVLNCVNDALLKGRRYMSTASLGFDEKKKRTVCTKRGSGSEGIYTQLSRWPERIAGACSDHRCESGFTCVPQVIGYACHSEKAVQKGCSKHAFSAKRKHCKPNTIAKTMTRTPKSKKSEEYRQTYDCANLNSSFPHIVAVPESGILHIFNYTVNEFEAFKTKLGTGTIDFVVDFIRCRLIVGRDDFIFAMDIKDFSHSPPHMQIGSIKFLRFAPKANVLVFLTSTTGFYRIYTSRDNGNTNELVWQSRSHLHIVDITIHTSGSAVYCLLRNGVIEFDLINNTRMLHRAKRSWDTAILLNGEPVIVWFTNLNNGRVNFFNAKTRRHRIFPLQHKVSSIHSSPQGWTFIVDDRWKMQIYNNDMKHMGIIPLTRLTGDTKISFYLG